MIARFLKNYILQVDQNWQRRTSFGCQNLSGRTDFDSKSGPGATINFGKISAEIGPAIYRLILRRTDFEITGQRAIGSYIARSVEVVISQYLIRLDFIIHVSRSEKKS